MGTHKYTFDCPSCNETTTMVAGKTPTWCVPCSDARRDFGAVMRGRNYPRKACAGCGTHMSNFDYGREQYCAECAEIKRKQYNGWGDPRADKPKRILVAANDNYSRVCTTCNQELPLDSFSGGHYHCKSCRADRRGDRSAEYAKRDEARGFDRLRNRRVRLIERARQRRLTEKRAIGRKISDYLRKWHISNDKPWLRPGLSEAERYRVRYANDNKFVLRERTRQRIRRKGFGFNVMWRMRQALYGDVGDRGLRSIEGALGYSMADLARHLEGQFTDGMSWDAFRSGRIHIDHKVPLSRHNLDDPEQLLAAWSLENLQPLWAADNMAKGARTDEEWRAAA